MNKIKIKIEGMHCGACATGIQMYLTNTEGVTKAQIDYNKKEGEVEYDESRITQEGVLKAVSELGYSASPV